MMKDLIEAAGEFFKEALKVIILGDDTPPETQQEEQEGSP